MNNLKIQARAIEDEEIRMRTQTDTNNLIKKEETPCVERVLNGSDVRKFNHIFHLIIILSDLISGISSINFHFLLQCRRWLL